MNNRFLTAALGITLTSALLCGPGLAASAQAAPLTPASRAQELLLEAWSAADRNTVAERARSAGDGAGAAVAVRMAERVEMQARSGRPTSDARNIWTTIAKKAVLQALRYGANKLPAKMRPYVNKIIDVVEEIDQFQQSAVVLALTKAGVPYDVAVTAAQWIVIFIGL